MQRIEEFKYDAQPEQKHHFIAKEFIKKIKKMYVYTSILDRFQNILIFRTMPKTIHELVLDDLREAQMAYFYTIGTGPYKGIIENHKIMKVCLSETYASKRRSLHLP